VAITLLEMQECLSFSCNIPSWEKVTKIATTHHKSPLPRKYLVLQIGVCIIWIQVQIPLVMRAYDTKKGAACPLGSNWPRIIPGSTVPPTTANECWNPRKVAKRTARLESGPNHWSSFVAPLAHGFQRGRQSILSDAPETDNVREKNK
jgi:hypothetical protein